TGTAATDGTRRSANVGDNNAIEPTMITPSSAVDNASTNSTGSGVIGPTLPDATREIAHTAITARLNVLPPSKTRRDGRNSNQAAKSTCTQATSTKKVPCVHAWAKCSLLTAK